MANLTFDQLPAASSVDGTETLPIMQSGVTKRTTLSAASIISSFTAAQLSTLATDGDLIQYATYVANDEAPYQQWALDAFTLGSPLGGGYVNVQVAGASGGVVEIQS